jgi:hypothetical protein
VKRLGVRVGGRTRPGGRTAPNGTLHEEDRDPIVLSVSPEFGAR